MTQFNCDEIDAMFNSFKQIDTNNITDEQYKQLSGMQCVLEHIDSDSMDDVLTDGFFIATYSRYLYLNTNVSKLLKQHVQ